MPKNAAAYEDIQFLTGSPQRRSVLAALREEPARPHELCAEIDATRTTIQRILAGFRERQWVVKRDGDYRATVTGHRIGEQYESLRAEIDRAQRFGPLAEHLGPVGDDLPAVALEDGHLTVGDEGSPLAPLSRSTEWFRTAEGSVSAVSPVVAEPFNQIGAELLEAETSIEFVIDATVLEQSKAEYESALQLGVEHDRIDIYVHESRLPLGVAIDDEGCCIVAYDGSDNIRAVLESTSDEVSEWAIGVFDRYRERATPLRERYDGDGAATADDTVK